MINLPSWKAIKRVRTYPLLTCLNNSSNKRKMRTTKILPREKWSSYSRSLDNSPSLTKPAPSTPFSSPNTKTSTTKSMR